MVAVCRRLIAPNVQKKVFLPGGATATSTSAVQVSDLTCDSDKQIYFTKLSTYTKIKQIDKSWLYGVNSVYIRGGTQEFELRSIKFKKYI